jgi:hypothetical protein
MTKSISWTYNDEFEKNGFFVIKNMCNPNLLLCEIPNENLRGKVTRYNKRRLNPLVKEEVQVIGSTSRFNFPPYESIFIEIKPVIENFIGRKLYKTYYYDRFYFSNQRLEKHIDREACEISCSLHISSNTKKPWGFKLITLSNEETEVFLEPGDAIIYKGSQVLHWRDSLESKYNKFERIFRKILRLKDDTYYHQGFFHYVLQDGNFVQYANNANYFNE